jgi:hypothetical protein
MVDVLFSDKEGKRPKSTNLSFSKVGNEYFRVSISLFPFILFFWTVVWLHEGKKDTIA